ncbi:MCE family protein [Thermomonospora umbrina]|uniref:Phospholipid/cholesterol/gamma-HCH transport system substrate-binding protein n=1 Tax=Thermomonospora umbrina TaxID=111806 RepID=A0A3D9SQA9_9ACTN|nr:MCE family protein [Thermomonospora umbrina]REE97807.1 phospholipid/cholesterol/gamma-HCH transport system substrate-binding protein [Thermomonospora umbrina]
MTGTRRRSGANEVVKRRFAGAAFMLIPVLLVALSVAVYDKRFVKVTWVTLHTAKTGNSLHRFADVKMRGVPIGEVREIKADGSGATLKLAMNPDLLHLVPANVTAQMLPTTLFGQRYVALIPPAQPETRRLSGGSVIGQDRSSNSIELQQVLDNLMPLLTAVQPQKLSLTLGAVAKALEGRGTQLGQTMVELDAYLKKVNPHLPALNRGINELVQLTQEYNEALPEVIQALHDATYTSRTLVDQRANLSAVYSSVTAASQDLDDFLRENSSNIIRLSASSRNTLEKVAQYSPELPCTLRMLNDFIPRMDRVLGKGTKTPGLQVDVTTMPSRGQYRPGRDTPKYKAKGGPHCYPVPFTGTEAPKVSRGGLGLPNSSEENRIINELLAPELQDVPEALPDWSSLLLGPVYRGREVTLR